MALPKNLPSLTSCRFFAALGVAIFHMSCLWPVHILDPIAQVGWLGVPFFFILSGFVLMWSFEPAQPKRNFYVHRLSRIYPLHVTGLIISLAAYHYYGTPLAGFVGTDLSTVTNFLLVHGWFPGHPEIRQSWNGVSWTLSCEFFFYMLAPYLFLTLIATDLTKLFSQLFCLWLLFALCSYYSDRHGMTWQSDFLQYHPFPNLLDFILGAIAAQYVKCHPQKKPHNLGLIVWILVISTWRGVYSGNDNPTLNLVVVPSFVFLIVTLAQKDLIHKIPIMQHNLLMLLGESSFALYMCHALIIGVTDKLLHDYPECFEDIRVPHDIGVLLLLTLSIIVSIVLHKYLEIPARRLIMKTFIRDKQTAIQF